VSDSMVSLAGGSVRIGSTAFYPEEAPEREVVVAGFSIDRTAVTNARFAEFVDDTGYVTVAERPLDPADFPDADLDSVDPGGLVFVPTRGPVDLRNWRAWWRWQPGADWRHPRGPGTGIRGFENHPVVQVAYADACAYAEWDGSRLPTETEWEFAARGGLVGAIYAWGDEPQRPGALHANTWQGRFPYANSGAHGWIGTAPVGSFPPNGFGLYEMTGNTWEWTSDVWTADHREVAACCGPVAGQASRVTKGGSHLCAPEYCLRYRPAARSPQSEDSATTHLGFRCARDL